MIFSRNRRLGKHVFYSAHTEWGIMSSWRARVRSFTSYFTVILVMLIINIASLTSCWNFSYLIRRRVSLSFAFCHVLIKQILTSRSEGAERSAAVYWRESEWLHKAEGNPIDLVVIVVVCYISLSRPSTLQKLRESSTRSCSAIASFSLVIILPLSFHFYWRHCVLKQSRCSRESWWEK